jgi:hypothetical protein
MAKTLLNGVNEVLKRVNVIAGDASALTNLVDSARQHPIDITVQVINEGMDRLYSYAQQSMPKQQAESAITLVNGTRDYELEDDLIELHFPLIDRTNTQFIVDFPGGYDKMLELDPEQNDTGLPYFAAINPLNGDLHMDRAPTSVEAGRVYTYQYERDLVVAAADDEFPFTDVVFRSMVPCWAQLYKREMKNEFDTVLFNMSLGLASRYLSQLEPRDSYCPR